MIEGLEFNLSLIRHGQSTVNVNPDLMGQLPETPLTDLGKRQAEKLGRRLDREKRFDLIYFSPYTRALDTAKLATKQSIIIDEDLREYSAGDWTGVSRSQTITPDIKNNMASLNHTFLPPNGESLNQVQRRASIWLENNILYSPTMLSLSKERKAEKDILNIACFSHGMTIKCLLQYVMGFDRSLTWKVMIENTSISKLHFGRDGWRIFGINDYSHLGDTISV